MRALAAEKDCSIAQLAIAWLLAKPAATSVILGASKLAQLEDNLGAADVDLSAEEEAALDALLPPARPYPHWFIDLTADQAHTSALGAAEG
jgi:aryl-alcohol dehydrogenase-like predicted oxidoreductase